MREGAAIVLNFILLWLESPEPIASSAGQKVGDIIAELESRDKGGDFTSYAGALKVGVRFSNDR